MTIDAPWGVGRYLDETGSPQPIALSLVEANRETPAAVRRLAAWGFGPNDVVLIIAGVAEAIQFAPFQRAARVLGGVSCTAEPSLFDAGRTAAFLEQFELRAVVGLDSVVFDGLAALGDPSTILGRCSQLIVRPDALDPMATLGIAPAVLHILGPAVAIECPKRAGAHIGADAWRVGSNEGVLWVEPALGRDLSVGRVSTGVSGRVMRDRCPCGSRDPRIVVD